MTENKVDSTIILKPVAYFNDPFSEGESYFVLCDCYYYKDNDFKNHIPVNSNFRFFAKQILDACKAERPCFGVE